MKSCVFMITKTLKLIMSIFRGYCKASLKFVRLSRYPGIEAMGLTEAIVYAIKQCPTNMQPHLYNNIVIIGGSSKFQNFKVC